MKDEVLEKHKDIFKEYFEETMKTSCMVWGLEIPEAWVPIIDELCEAWKSFGWVQGDAQKPQLIAEQVKEKFGTLRFYYRLEQVGDTPPDFKWYEHVFDGMICYAEYRINKLGAGDEV